MNSARRHAQRIRPQSAVLLAVLAGLLGGLTAVTPSGGAAAAPPEPIRIGIVHSQTGTLAISETPLVSAAQMAIDEINAAGGIRGRRLEAVIVDSRSDPDVAASEAERLLTRERVVSLFGCWTSACRKAVLPVLQRESGLLWYPVQYEGRESSPFVIYTGAAPNQQILPAVDWAVDRFGKRVFLIGSDYVFPRTANLIIRERAAALGASIVGESYRPLGSTDVREVVAEILAARPDVVVNTINGDTNIRFFSELALSNPGPRIPTLSFSIAENEIRTIGTGLLQGNFVAWNYFQSLDTEENRRFVAEFRRRFGQNGVTSDPIEAAYFQLRAFAEAASNARDLSPGAIREAALGLSLATPGGYVRIDEKSQHTWKTVRLGEVLGDGQVRTIGDSVVAVEPKPFVGGADPAPALQGTAPSMAAAFTPASLLEAFSDPARTASAALALRELHSLPWTADDRLRVVLAAARSPSFLLRNEAGRAAGHFDGPRRDVISALLDSKDSFDLVTGFELLQRETSLNEGLAARAVGLLVHPSRRVRVAAGDALLAQKQRGWRAAGEATSRLISGLEDSDLAVQRNAIALGGSSKELASRVLPALAEVDLRDRPPHFLGALCGAMGDVLGEYAGRPRAERSSEGTSAARRVVLQIDRSSCMRPEQVAGLRGVVAQAGVADEGGVLRWLGDLYEDNGIVGRFAATGVVLLLGELVLLLAALLALLMWPAKFLGLLARLSRLEKVRIQRLGLSMSLFHLLSPTWLKDHPRVIDGWIGANLNAYRQAFEERGTIYARRKHVPLPVMIARTLETVEPSPQTVRELLQGGRLHIVGEGGTGKTSLACVIGRWAMSADADDRVGPLSRRGKSAPMISILVEAGAPAAADPTSFLTFLQRALTMPGEQEPSAWLVKNLVRHGKLLVILDDALEAGMDGAVVSGSELPGLALIATTRVELPATWGDWKVIRPQKLRGLALTEFFVSYTRLAGYADKIGADDLEAYIMQFKQLLGANESRQETVVYFARLFLDYVFESQPKAGMEAELSTRRPRSVPELVESFVDYTCRRTAQKHKLAEIEVVGLVRKVANRSLSDRQQPAPLLVQVLATESEALKWELGIPAEVDLEQVLIDSGLLDRPTAYSLRFKVDLVHEYCAVFHIRDLASASPDQDDAYGIWTNWVNQLATSGNGRGTPSGLLRATYECLRSDRVPGDFLGGLLQRVAELVGADDSNLQPIRIGILHSLQGTMAISELALRDAALLAVEEVNSSGGIAGRQIEAIVRDGASDPEQFAREARRLVREDGVVSIFGCWTSQTRKSVKPVVEAERSLLWYPVQYEGYEQSEAIIYAGAAPNQQILPAVDWCLTTLLPERGVDARDARVYLVGSDYVFPRRANAIVRRHLQAGALEPVGECYRKLGSMDFSAIVAEIESIRPHVVINTLNGSSNIGFFQCLDERGIRPSDCPVISLSVAEAEVRDIGLHRLEGHYAVWNYFQSLATAANKRFVDAFHDKYGMGRVTSDPIATAYASVKLFAEAARQTRSSTTAELRRQLAGVEMETPAGRIRFDETTGHFTKHVYIGRVNHEGQFDVVNHWNNGQMVPPDPFPYPDLAKEFVG